jgi:hypothetical protein
MNTILTRPFASQRKQPGEVGDYPACLGPECAPTSLAHGCVGDQGNGSPLDDARRSFDNWYDLYDGVGLPGAAMDDQLKGEAEDDCVFGNGAFSSLAGGTPTNLLETSTGDGRMSCAPDQHPLFRGGSSDFPCALPSGTGLPGGAGDDRLR